MNERLSLPTDFAQNAPDYVDVNFIAYLPHTVHAHSKTSAFILNEAFSTLPMEPAWKPIIQRLQNISGLGKTVWGIKQEGDKFSVEFYFYYPNQYPSHTLERVQEIVRPFLPEPFPAVVNAGRYECLSFNVESAVIAGLNVYGMGASEDAQSIKAHSYFLAAGQADMTPVNTYHALLKDSGFHQDGFHFSDASKKVQECSRRIFAEENFTLAPFYQQYSYLHDASGTPLNPVGVAEKINAIGLYFMGLSVAKFLEFLKAHDYPLAFIQRIAAEEKNLAHIRYDIGIDFYSEQGVVRIKKTAFFGSV